MQFRKPSEQEMNALMDEWGMDDDTFDYPAIVCMNYMPDSPGWCGDILMTIGGHSGAYTNYKIIENVACQQCGHKEIKLEKITQEF